MKTIKIEKYADIPENYTYTGIVKYSWGKKEWYLNGELHRENGPAIEYPNGDKYWLLNGQLHRTDGPAIEYSGGSKQWCLNNKFLDPNKINQFVYKFDYPIETAIKLTYWLEINKP